MLSGLHRNETNHDYPVRNGGNLLAQSFVEMGGWILICPWVNFLPGNRLEMVGIRT